MLPPPALRYVRLDRAEIPRRARHPRFIGTYFVEPNLPARRTPDLLFGGSADTPANPKPSHANCATSSTRTTDAVRFAGQRRRRSAPPSPPGRGEHKQANSCASRLRIRSGRSDRRHRLGGPSGCQYSLRLRSTNLPDWSLEGESPDQGDRRFASETSCLSPCWAVLDLFIASARRVSRAYGAGAPAAGGDARRPQGCDARGR